MVSIDCRVLGQGQATLQVDSRSDALLIGSDCLKQADPWLEGALQEFAGDAPNDADRERCGLALIGADAAWELKLDFGQNIPVIVGSYGAEIAQESTLEPLIGCDPFPREKQDLLRQYFDHVTGLRVAYSGFVPSVTATGCSSLDEFVGGVMGQVVDEMADTHYLVERRRTWDIVPRQLDKGRALQRLMALDRFAGRRPVYIGFGADDLPAIDTAERMGGIGVLWEREMSASSSAVKAVA